VNEVREGLEVEGEEERPSQEECVWTIELLGKQREDFSDFEVNVVVGDQRCCEFVLDTGACVRVWNR